MENTQPQEKSCKKCKQKGVSTFQKGSIVLGFYILITSGIGTVELIKKIYNLFF